MEESRGKKNMVSDAKVTHKNKGEKRIHHKITRPEEHL